MWTTMTMTGGVDGASLKIGAKSFTEEALLAAITKIELGKLGEICASYCLKGRRVYIEGRLRTREYEGSDGLRRHSTEIIAETMKLLDRPRTDDDAAHHDAGGGIENGAPGTDVEPGGLNGERAGKRNKLEAAPTA
jgi:single-stranded DNA-binding protein